MITVPKGIRYISDWEKLENGYSLRNFPFPHILDKQITGCGFTEYCIRNDMNVVICSPRRILLENKMDQHCEEFNVFYFKNEIESLDYDCDLLAQKPITNVLPTKELIDDESIEKYKLLDIQKGRLNQHLVNCSNQLVGCKILVTYDSFRHVKDVLSRNNVLDKFYIVIDEFQSIFVDSKFKSDTEIELLDQLTGINNLCFVSATPMIDKYLEMLDEFKDLPYFEFDWKTAEPGRIMKPWVNPKQSKSVLYDINNIIKEYLSGEFQSYVFRDDSGKVHEIISKEAVIYVNSVKNICEIIKRCGLTPDNTNVLCSNTNENLKKIKKAFKVSCNKIGGIGSIPGKGEPHKMFTLCTRTVYLGADFYSTNARSFVVSDANIDSLAVDISLDLPQILGRQRLDENPWKNRVELIYRPLRKGKSMTKDDFDKVLNQKYNNTLELIDAFNKIDSIHQKHLIAQKYEVVAKVDKYKSDFLSVNHHAGSVLKPVLNKLVMVSEMRTYDLQQINYCDRVSVLNSLSEDYVIEFDKITEIVQEFYDMVHFPDKMRLVCCSGLDAIAQKRLLSQIPLIYGTIYEVIGPVRCKELQYKRESLLRELDSVRKCESSDLKSRLVDEFKIGERYSRIYIKNKLSEIYLDLGIQRTPKAVDILNYFETRDTYITRKGSCDGDMKRDKGYLILGVKL